MDCHISGGFISLRPSVGWWNQITLDATFLKLDVLARSRGRIPVIWLLCFVQAHCKAQVSGAHSQTRHMEKIEHGKQSYTVAVAGVADKYEVCLQPLLFGSVFLWQRGGIAYSSL